MIKNVIFGVLV